MRDVAGVNHERWLLGQRPYPPDRFFQRSLGIRVGRLIKTHMAVADLQEGEALALLRQRLIDGAELRRHSTSDGPQYAGPRPGHAFQNLAAAWTFSWAFIVIVSGHIRLLCNWLHRDRIRFRQDLFPTFFGEYRTDTVYP